MKKIECPVSLNAVISNGKKVENCRFFFNGSSNKVTSSSFFFIDRKAIFIDKSLNSKDMDEVLNLDVLEYSAVVFNKLETGNLESLTKRNHEKSF